MIQEDHAMRSTNKKGFTLIELLIVVVIIGILAAIAIPKFANTKEKAYIAAMKSDLRNMATAEESYFADNQTYTTSLTAMNFTSSAAVTANVSDAKGTGWAADTKHPATAITCQVGFGSDSITGVGDGVIQCK
jgi:prepilin-type N-terminal cleavage/methylation domain-containing protein